MNKAVLILLFVILALVKSDFVSISKTKDYKNAPNILTLKFKGITCDEFMKQGISSRIRGGKYGHCLPLSENARALDQIRFSGRCFNVNHNAIVEVLELKTKGNERIARDIDSIDERKLAGVKHPFTSSYQPYPHQGQDHDGHEPSYNPSETPEPTNTPVPTQAPSKPPQEPDHDEILEPNTPFWIRLKTTKRTVHWKVLSYLTQKSGGHVHQARIPNCYKTTDICNPPYKYVNFCKRNVQERSKLGLISKEEGPVFLLVNARSNSPDTCKDDGVCCSYVNGYEGVCKYSELEGEEKKEKEKGKTGQKPLLAKGKVTEKQGLEDDDDEEEEEKIVDFGAQEKDNEKKDINTPIENKELSQSRPKMARSKIVGRNKEEEEEDEEEREGNKAHGKHGQHQQGEEEDDERDNKKEQHHEDEDDEREIQKGYGKHGQHQEDEDDEREIQKGHGKPGQHQEGEDDEREIQKGHGNFKQQQQQQEDEDDKKKSKIPVKREDEDEEEEEEDERKKRSNIISLKKIDPVSPPLMKLTFPNKK